MKKVILISILFVAILGCRHAYAQGIPIYSIPSFNIEVNGYANFRENRQSESLMQTEGRRVIDVEVKTPSKDENCQATVWIYSLDHTTVLGPYTVNCDEPLAVTIDTRLWGVLVESDELLLVDVWIE